MEFAAQSAPIAAPAPAGPGRVTLAGAGPGDPELLTVKALRRLAEADVIVHDALISEAIRALFPPGALVFDVGKRAGTRCEVPQDETNRLLVRLARQGMRVVRLKGGDPLVFGRGGEEALHLAAAGIPCEIVPGISAANGAASAAGIPLTHRGLSRACILLDGHGPHLDSIDWRALVTLGGTWVFFMAAHGAQDIARRLLAHGAEPALPLALVQGASRPGERVVQGILEAVAREGLPATGGEPGLVLVGPTVALRESLAPFIVEERAHGAPLSPQP